jgi:hypothetical protein
MFQSLAAVLGGKGARDNDILYGTSVGITLTVVVVTTYAFRCLDRSAFLGCLPVPSHTIAGSSPIWLGLCWPSGAL